MALFGAPIAHEDHAVRAVAAALTAQADSTSIEKRLASERRSRPRGTDRPTPDRWSSGRIGDDLRNGLTAQGETVNSRRAPSRCAGGRCPPQQGDQRLSDGYFRNGGARHLFPEGADRRPRYDVVGRRGRRTRFEVALERGPPFVGR